MFPFTLHQLRILRTIAAEQSFTKAAERLYLSQPSLSKQLKILEDSLGLLLINRNEKHRFMTENGKLLLKYSERILALCKERCRALNDLKNEERGNFSIGVSQTIETYLFPKLFVFFTQKYPQITLNFQVYSDEILVKHIYEKTIDVAIVNKNVIQFRDPKITITPFVITQLDLIVSKFHPFTIKKKIKKNEIYSLEYVSLSNDFIEKIQIDRLLKQNKINPTRLKTVAKLHSIDSIKAAVDLGLGSAFVPTWAFSMNKKKKFITPITIKNFQIVQKFYIVLLNTRKKSEVFEFFWTELVKLKIEICS